MTLKGCWNDSNREKTHSSGPGGQHGQLEPPGPARCLLAPVLTTTESVGWTAAAMMQGSYSPTGIQVEK